jgi:hypothetical protein
MHFTVNNRTFLFCAHSGHVRAVLASSQPTDPELRLRHTAPASHSPRDLEELQHTSSPIPDHRTLIHISYRSTHLTPHSHALDVGAACLTYQRLLVNSYCTSDLCRPRGRARPPSASCDRRTFALTRSGAGIDLPGRCHSKMSDPADAWFPRPSTPPDTRRQKDDTHHGFPRPRAYCAFRTHTDDNSRRAPPASSAWCDLCVQPASCAWCDKEELQHTSFLLMTMPGWTCMHTLATRATQP